MHIKHKTEKRSNPLFKDCALRSLMARRREFLSKKAWKKKHGHGMRREVESAISDNKRMQGESVTSHSRHNIAC
ncbi:MAG: hypothetical protein WCS17_04545 [Prevotella sp.]